MPTSQTPGQRLVDRVYAFAAEMKIPLARIFEQAHVDPSTFWRWKRGVQSPHMVTVDRVEKAFRELRVAR